MLLIYDYIQNISLIKTDKLYLVSVFPGTVEEGLLILKQAAADVVAENIWTAEKLDEEREANNKCWEAHNHLNAAVARVEDGLVERGEDARLVVLAMIANEHILLLGKPGTGKFDRFEISFVTDMEYFC